MFTAAFAYLFSVSQLFLPLLLSLFIPSPNKQEVANSSLTGPLELSLVLQIPFAPGHEPQCPKLFPSTDINYLDLL